MDAKEKRWLLICVLAMLIVPLAFDIGYFYYKVNLINSWNTNHALYASQIQAAVNASPGYFNVQERVDTKNFNISEAVAKTASNLEISKTQFQFTVTTILIPIVFVSLLIYQNPLAKDPVTSSSTESEIAIKRYDTDMDLAKWLMNLGGAGGSSVSVISGILLSNTSGSLFVIVALPVFVMIIIFGLQARSIMSSSIQSENEKAVKVNVEGYDAFWDSIRLQYFLLFLGIPLLALGILTSLK